MNLQPHYDLKMARRSLKPADVMRPHEEVTADYNDLIYAATPKEIETRRKAFIRK